MSKLTDNLNQKITSNEYSITIIEGNKPETQEAIELFSFPTIKIDSQIVAITTQINSLQSQIVSLSENAFAVGCGTTVGVTTVYPDVVRTYSENISSSTYDGESPFSSSSSALSSANVGVGTYLVYTQNDNTQSGIGSLYADLQTCYRTPCTSGVCVSHASSISTLQSEVSILQTQLSNLVSDSNKIKTERREYEIERYAQNYSIKILENTNTRISLAITAIQNNS